jgi:NAD(P)H-hydrate epimerase
MIIKAVTSGEMRKIDRIAIEEFGIPASVLMNNAGRSAASYIQKKFNEREIIIFCGSGNNGGDGFTAAYYLANAGLSPVIYLSGKKNTISETSKIFMNLCVKLNVPIHEIEENSINTIRIPRESIIVDAVLGTGSTDSPRGIPLEFIRLINRASGFVVSIDIPSGLSSDGEYPPGEFVTADITITIGLPKISLVTYPCKPFCGEIIIEDIGFPSTLTSNTDLKVSLIDDNYFKTLNIFTAGSDTHKGERGHTLIIGGFDNMEGAALLAASALFHTGCGLVTIGTTSESRRIIAGKIPEAMTFPLPDNPDSHLIDEFFQKGKFTSMIIGPGLGRTSYSEGIFKKIIDLLNQNFFKRVLIDGDGLFHLAEYLKDRKLPDNAGFIITPHLLEASRILGKSVELIKRNRLESCKELAEKTGCITILKGPASIVSDGNISFINTTGNPGLATAGSGDVLSGIIAAVMNMDISLIDAASAGVFIHGASADIFSKNAEPFTMCATDIIKNIRTALSLKTPHKQKNIIL